MKADLVFEGGSVKLLAHIGAFAALESRGFRPSHVAGTSAGAIISAAIAAGYSSAELKRLSYDMNFNDFLDGSRWPWKRGWDLIHNKGIHKGDAFHAWIKNLLADKGVYTFKDLVSNDPDDQEDPKYRWRLKVIASDISNGRMVVFPNDAHLYGIEPDDMSVADAVRMSMSIPFYFRPVIIGDEDNYVIDGGINSNYPIWIFDSDHAPPWPTFGLLLGEKDFRDRHQIDGFFDMIKAVFNTMMQANDRRNIRTEDFIMRTISIPTGNVGMLDFDLPMAKKQELFHYGFSSAINFLDNWSWPDYREWAIRIRGLR